MVGFAGSNTLLQSLVSDRLRGRMMSLFTVTFMGLSPFGSLLGGMAADRIGAPATLGFCAALCLAASAWYRSRDGAGPPPPAPLPPAPLPPV